jgi:hypothetical protein
MAVRDGRNCHFGGRSWNTLGDCGWGLAVRLIDLDENPKHPGHACKSLVLVGCIDSRAGSACQYFLEYDGPSAIYTRPKTHFTSTRSMLQPKNVIPRVRLNTDPNTPILHASFRFPSLVTSYVMSFAIQLERNSLARFS